MPHFSDIMAQGCALKEVFHHSMAAPGRTKVTADAISGPTPATGSGLLRSRPVDAAARLTGFHPLSLCDSPFTEGCNNASRRCCETDGIPSAIPLRFAFHRRLQQHHQGAQTGFLWPPDLLPLLQGNSVISLLQFDAEPNSPSVPLIGKRPEDRKKP